MKDYYETLADKEAENRAGEIKTFQPETSAHGNYAVVGWTFTNGSGRPVNRETNWRLVSGDTLTPDTPITLEQTGFGLKVTREISVDDNYLFTYRDTVTNVSDKEMGVQSYSLLRQHGEPPHAAKTYGVHRGFIGANGSDLMQLNYKNMTKGKERSELVNKGGWAGLTDKYWLSAIIPPQDQPFKVSQSTITDESGLVFQTRVDGTAVSLSPQESVTSETHVFSGPKRSAILKSYQKELGAPRFVDAIDWGRMFFWLTKPFFSVLSFINSYVGNFGVSILIFTVLVKLVFFPIQNRAYQSMAKMRELSEPMKKIREEVPDKQEQQKKIAELFREKKVNPVAGCFPLLLQMPVFYALFKTLNVTIEMRHTPFFGWIQDLSAPDPTAVANLWGLLPYSADVLTGIPLIGFLFAVGIFPVMYGLTMWALQSLSPPPTDDTQRMIFAFLPLIFTFVFAGFAAGLVIYWVWSNILSIIQQYIIMRRNGQKTQLDKLIDRLFAKGETQS